MIRRRKFLGFGFTDEIAKVTSATKSFKHSHNNDWKDVLIPNYTPEDRTGLEKSFWRVTTFVCITLFCFFALFLKLFQLQIAEGSHNRELADGNRIVVKVVHAPRGVIFDRNGKVIAANSPGFRLTDPETKKTIYLTREEALEMEVNNDSRAAHLEVDTVRTYPEKEKLAHVLGYVGEISVAELKDQKYRNYRSGDRIGKSGLESYYEHLLRGKDGGEIIEIDAQGKKLRTIRTISPIAGQDLYITIDSDLQTQAYQILKESTVKSKSCCAALVAMSPQDGQILALVSFPSFDPNIFTDNQRSDEITKIFTHPDSPVLNRVIGGVYPPGSTFKIVSSLAALASGKITENTQYEDTGQVFLGPYSFANWYFTQHGKTEGLVNVVKALKRSNDTYYYKIAQVIGEKPLIEWSRKLLLGQSLGIDLGGEVSGLVPDNEWKEKTVGQSWYPGDTLHLSIGQGFLLTTPLQVLGMTSFIAGDGKLYKPTLFLKTARNGNQTIQEFTPSLLLTNIAEESDIKVIKRGLEEVTADGGTAWPFLGFPIKTAGKTGTAEFGDPDDKTHAWYTAYAPSDEPKIALTVLVEGGGEGSSVTGPIAKEVLRWYLSPDKRELLKDIYSGVSSSAQILGE